MHPAHHPFEVKAKPAAERIGNSESAVESKSGLYLGEKETNHYLFQSITHFHQISPLNDRQ